MSRGAQRTPDAWARTLVGGVVVLVAVTGLLETLRRSVSQVDRQVDRVWAAGKMVAANTQAAHLLGDTRRQVGGLRALTTQQEEAEGAQT